MLKQMPYTELVDWVAYSRIEPFGEERDDWRAALIASVIAEVNRGRTKRRKPFQPKDFLLRFEGPKRQEWKTQLQMVEMLNSMFGGKDKRPGRAVVSTRPTDGEAGR